MCKKFVQKGFNLILLTNTFFLIITYQIHALNVYYCESLKLFSVESSAVKQLAKRTIGDLNSKCSTHNRPSLHLPNSILKTRQIYKLYQNFFCVFCISFVYIYLTDKKLCLCRQSILRLNTKLY